MKNELLIMMLLLALVAGYVAIAIFDRGAGKKLSKRSRFLKKPVNPVTEMPDQPFQSVPVDVPPAPLPTQGAGSQEENPTENWTENGGVLNCEKMDASASGQ